MKGYLGVDVGSVSTNLVVIDKQKEVISLIYIRTQGQPINAVKQGLNDLEKDLNSKHPDIEIIGVGTTGSARFLSGVMVGADIIKNEITAHAIAAAHVTPGAKTVLEIGGQDSKIILLRKGVVMDFAMNTVCAAGTGSFLDHQSSRLGIPIEEFGDYALNSSTSCQIAGRCSVFAESDMIHKQQMGYQTEDIIYGLCQALVRNYLNNLAKGKDILSPIVFQGGVAANAGMKKAFEESLKMEIIVPQYHHVMGAIGAALLAQKNVDENVTNFRGFTVANTNYQTRSFYCKGCENNCEIVKIQQIENNNKKTLACWGGRCGKWEVGNPEELEAANV